MGDGIERAVERFKVGFHFVGRGTVSGLVIVTHQMRRVARGIPHHVPDGPHVGCLCGEGFAPFSVGGNEAEPVPFGKVVDNLLVMNPR